MNKNGQVCVSYYMLAKLFDILNDNNNKNSLFHIRMFLEGAAAKEGKTPSDVAANPLRS